MSYKIRIIKFAQIDIRETYKYVADKLQSPVVAAKLVSLIDKKIESLKNNPERFMLVPDGYLASKGYRVLIVKNHLVFFVVHKDERVVSIMRVLYGRRDWMNLLKVDVEEESDS